MCSVLIAEDESRIAAFIEKGLRHNGFRTAIATNGEQALLMIQKHKYDLLLLDLGLPIKDGLTVMKELRSLGYQLPIVVVSAYDKPDNISMTNYLSKPFRFQDLLDLIKFHL